MTAAPAHLNTRRQIHVNAGMRSRMSSFVVGETILLLNDRDVTVGHLRRDDPGIVRELAGTSAWCEFKIGRMVHRELLTLSEVKWAKPCAECKTPTRVHAKGCRLDMSRLHPFNPPVAP